MYLPIGSLLALATLVVAVAVSPEAGAVLAGLTVVWVTRGHTDASDAEPSPELRRLVRDAQSAHEIAPPSWDFYQTAGQRLPRAKARSALCKPRAAPSSRRR